MVEILVRMRTEEKTAYNSGFASGRMTCQFGALCFCLSKVLVDSIVLRNLPERKARKRYNQWYEDRSKTDRPTKI